MVFRAARPNYGVVITNSARADRGLATDCAPRDAETPGGASRSRQRHPRSPFRCRFAGSYCPKASSDVARLGRPKGGGGRSAERPKTSSLLGVVIFRGRTPAPIQERPAPITEVRGRSGDLVPASPAASKPGRPTDSRSVSSRTVMVRRVCFTGFGAAWGAGSPRRRTAPVPPPGPGAGEDLRHPRTLAGSRLASRIVSLTDTLFCYRSEAAGTTAAVTLSAASLLGPSTPKSRGLSTSLISSTCAARCYHGLRRYLHVPRQGVTRRIARSRSFQSMFRTAWLSSRSNFPGERPPAS